MLNMGDEIGRTQNGSNNGYSLPRDKADLIEDTPENFLGGWANKWDLDELELDLRDSVSELVQIRKKYIEVVAHDFFTGILSNSTCNRFVTAPSSGCPELNGRVLISKASFG